MRHCCVAARDGGVFVDAVYLWIVDKGFAHRTVGREETRGGKFEGLDDGLRWRERERGSVIAQQAERRLRRATLPAAGGGREVASSGSTHRLARTVVPHDDGERLEEVNHLARGTIAVSDPSSHFRGDLGPKPPISSLKKCSGRCGCVNLWLHLPKAPDAADRHLVDGRHGGLIVYFTL